MTALRSRGRSDDNKANVMAGTFEEKGKHTVSYQYVKKVEKIKETKEV